MGVNPIIGLLGRKTHLQLSRNIVSCLCAVQSIDAIASHVLTSCNQPMPEPNAADGFLQVLEMGLYSKHCSD